MSWKLRLFGYGMPLLGFGSAVFSHAVQVNPAPLWFVAGMGGMLGLVGMVDYITSQVGGSS